MTWSDFTLGLAIGVIIGGVVYLAVIAIAHAAVKIRQR
jgi:hypothetical protein